MTPDRLTYLEQQLRSFALNERKAALDELAQVSSEIAVPVLERLAAEPDFLYRRLAVMGLGNHPTPESLALLKQLLLREKDSNVLSEIANSLFEFGEVAIELLPQLFDRSDHWLVHQTVIGILVDSDYPDLLLEMIQKGLKEPDVTTRESAILAIGKLVNGPLNDFVMPILLELAESERWRDRWRTATVLSICQDDRARAARVQLRQDDNHYVVAAALEGSLGES